MIEAKQTVRQRTQMAAAVEFLLSVLADGEMASADVDALRVQAGISKNTFDRARQKLGVRARQTRAGWRMSLPEPAEVLRTGHIREPQFAQSSTPRVSTDWVSIAAPYSLSDELTEVAPDRGSSVVAPPSECGVLSIKVGAFELTASADYPTDKLAALLRELGGALC